MIRGKSWKCLCMIEVRADLWVSNDLWKRRYRLQNTTLELDCLELHYSR